MEFGDITDLSDFMELWEDFHFLSRRRGFLKLTRLFVKKQPPAVFNEKRYSQNSQENTCDRVSFLIKF